MERGTDSELPEPVARPAIIFPIAETIHRAPRVMNSAPPPMIFPALRMICAALLMTTTPALMNIAAMFMISRAMSTVSTAQRTISAGLSPSPSRRHPTGPMPEPSSGSLLMSTIPRTQAEAIQFIEIHLPIWIENPGAIGLSPQQLTALADAATLARQDLAAASQAREAAEAATTKLRGSMDAMRAIAGPVIATIRAFAEGSADPAAIYGQAQIPPRADRSPAPAPQMPVFRSVDLLGNGALKLSWRVKRPAPNSPVHTRIRRRLHGETWFTLLGDTAGKFFIDQAIPLGCRGGPLLYQFQAVAGGRESGWSQAIGVQLGSVATAHPVKLAA